METTHENIRVADLLQHFDDNSLDLINTISSVSDDDFNKTPFEASWTAAQVTQHLVKAERILPELLLRNTEETERKFDEKVASINSIFLDFSTKLKSAEAIMPDNEIHKKEEFIQAIKTRREEIRKAIQATDLSLLCRGLDFPTLGSLTGFEWIQVILTHSQRHIRQLKNIQKKLEHPAE